MSPLLGDSIWSVSSCSSEGLLQTAILHSPYLELSSTSYFHMQTHKGLQTSMHQSWIDYCNNVLAGTPRTVTDKLQHVLNAAARHHRAGSDTAQRTSLARRPQPGVFQAGSDSSPVSEWLHTTVSVGLLRPGRWC